MVFPAQRHPCLRLLAALCVFYLFSCSNGSSPEEVPPLSKLSQNVGGPTLKFLYCYSCGYRKMFDEYVNIIHQKYPYITVDGKNYDPPGFNMFLARLIVPEVDKIMSLVT